MRLATVTRTQGNNQALKDGRVSPRGFDFDFVEVPVLPQAFRRMVRELAFDVCEMAFTTYLCAREHGKPFTALPIFLVRGFHHGAAVRNADGPVKTPTDLAGRRVGVNRGYTVTTGVWARGILHEEYGVDLDRVTWVLSGDEHVAEYRPPSNVEPMRPEESLETVAAAVGIEADPPRTVPLIPDASEAGFVALRERGLYPINHLVVVRDDLLAAHAGLGAAIFDAFAAAKKEYLDRLTTLDAPADLTYRRVMEITGEDPLPYGIEPNLAMIEKLIEYAVNQRILRQRPSVADLFHPV